MNKFFDFVVEFFNLIWSYIVNLVESVTTMLSVLFNLPSFVLTFTGVIPSIIGTSVLIVTSISIVKLIAGWGNQ